MSNVTWTPDPDGEYGSEKAEVKNQQLEVYSDRDGEQWWYTIDEGPSQGSYKTRAQAQAAAVADAEGE